MKLEKDKIYKLFENKNLYIVQCIDVENRDFKTLKSYSADLDEYWDIEPYTVEEYELKTLLRNRRKKYELVEFNEFEILL